jgi:hypothetical protein
MNNPFKPATKVAKKLKVLLYGASGSGKTLAALTFPRAAVIDTEGGTDLYAGRAGVPAFNVMRANSLAQVEEAMRFIQADNSKTIETLIVDSVSVLYDVQKEAADKANQNNGLGYREWGKVNNRMVYLYNALANLNVHVVVTAREAIEYETVGKELRRVGFKPDADKRLVYMFDFIIRMTGDHTGLVEKSRGLDMGRTMPVVAYESFLKASGMFAEGTPAPSLDVDAAAAVDAQSYIDPTPQAIPVDMLRFADTERFTNFVQWAKDTHDMTRDDVLSALYEIDGASFKEAPAKRAMKAVTDWVSKSKRHAS